MNTVIAVPEGAPGDTCDVRALVAHVEKSGCDYVVIAAQRDVLARHSKAHSLDYWLRVNCTARSNTMQATHALIDQLVSTGLLYRDKVTDPHTGRSVGGLRLSWAR